MHARQGPVRISPRPELGSLHFLGGPGGFCSPREAQVGVWCGKFLKLGALGEKFGATASCRGTVGKEPLGLGVWAPGRECADPGPHPFCALAARGPLWVVGQEPSFYLVL